MKTRIISLRTLVREPLKVKRWTRAGGSVQVTDNGRPLWLIQPAVPKSSEESEEQRRREIDEMLDEVLRGPRSKISLSKIVLDSRR
jgi:antitoxin (DNA-binding transcriptional repressor) of toxin-antitoxin stability system